MDIDEFAGLWDNRNRAELEWVIDTLSAAASTTEGQIDRVRSSRELAKMVHRSGRRRQVSEAAHRVQGCVRAACASTGVSDLDPDGATRLARAAGDVAVALVAGPDTERCEVLLRPFVSTMHAAAV